MINSHKRRVDYMAFTEKNPRESRGPSQPKTPDPDEDLSKRPWENKMRSWRRALRTWYADNVGGDLEDEISDDSES